MTIERQQEMLILITATKIRLRSMPAGCDKLVLVVVGARALVHSDLAGFVPRLEEICPLKEDYDRVLQRPLLYHIGAKYLTGKDQDTELADTEEAPQAARTKKRR
uniref:Uncharacterized protein n=1 Tax=Trichuris muris TaxID=70415 RepID=A0A5S6R2P0_TRIMR